MAQQGRGAHPRRGRLGRGGRGGGRTEQEDAVPCELEQEDAEAELELSPPRRASRRMPRPS